MDATPNVHVHCASSTPSSPLIEVGGGGGSQPANQPQTVVENPTSLSPRPSKKRKTNANGSRKTSTAWDHFTKLAENEYPDPTAACNYCGIKYLCHTKNHGTSNLLAHIKVCPKYTYAITNDINQTVLDYTPSSSGQGVNLVAASQRFNIEACRKALAVFIILDEQPFRVVEGEGFKYLCKTLQPQFTLPTRHTVPRDCFKMYLDEKERLREFFRTDCCRVALTTDCWTSVQNLGYLTLTAHFIDNDWKYQKRIISFSIVPNHKGETISKQIEEILREWGLRNVSSITVDNASSNDVALGHLKRRIKNMNGLVLDGQFLHMRCCAHVLNLVVIDGLKQYDRAISSVRTAVRFVRSSPQRLAKFKECVDFAGISSKKLVCLDVSTRWNSTYLMLEAAEKFEIAFEKLDVEDPSYLEYFGDSSPPNCGDWDKARAFMKFLKIFYDATKVFSTSVHVSIHSAFHQLVAIYTALKKSIANPDTLLNTMGKEMKQKYDKYWGNVLNMNQLIYFGVILDPRYKFRYVDFSFSHMYFDEKIVADNLKFSIMENLSKMFNWYVAVHNQQNIHSSSQGPFERGSLIDSACLTESITQLEISDAFKNFLKEKNSLDQKNELERYLDEENFNGDDKFELLVWWKQNSSRFPILSIMARDVLATPVSTVASESAFSTGGRVLDSFRSCLSPKMTEALICSQNWLRPPFFQFKDMTIEEDYETSEKIVTELCRPLSNFGGAPTRAAYTSTSEVGSSFQSQPTGCD